MPILCGPRTLWATVLALGAVLCWLLLQESFSFQLVLGNALQASHKAVVQGRLLSPKPAEVLVSQIPASSFQCDDAPWDNKVCWVHNLYIVGDASAATFVTNGSAPTFPPLKLFEYSNVTGSPVFGLHHFIHVITQTEAASMFPTAADAGHRPAARPGDPSPGSPWRALQHPEDGPHSTAQPGGAWKFGVVEHAVAVQPFLLSNWWHAMDDISNAAFRFCRYFGRCSFQELRSASTSVLLLNAGPLAQMKPAVTEVFSCLGSIRRVEFTHTLPPDQLRRQATASVHLVRTALFGLGDSFMLPFKALEVSKKPVESCMRIRQIEMLRQCAGLPSVSPPRSLPNLRVINREYGAGRTVLAMPEALAKLQQMKPKGQLEYKLELSFVAGLSFAQQARLYDETDILFTPHGAATANMIFLPRTAVVVHTGAVPYHLDQERSVAQELPTPYYNVQVVTLDAQGFTEPMVDKFFADPRFLALTPHEQLHFLRHCSIKDGNASRIVSKLYGYQSQDNWQYEWHYAMYNINLRPGADRIARALLDGLQLWYGTEHA